MAGPYGTMKRILQANESILDAAFTAHKVRHGWGKAANVRRGRYSVTRGRACVACCRPKRCKGARERTTSQPRSFMWTRTDLGLT